MPKLSIIVPVYNVEQYLHRCIDSILAQTFTDYEIILIDDGSPDRCGEIIDEYASRDDRIIPIHQSNRGVSAARNAGLKAAGGDYVGFVDPDDWIEPNMYSTLIGQIELNGCEIASCSWMSNDEEGHEIPYVSGLPTKVMDNEEYMRHLFDMPPTILGSSWSKLFRRDIIKTFFAENVTICEDNLFVAENCCNCSSAVYVNENLYHLFLRSNSATRVEIGRPALGLPVRRKIIDIARSMSVECGMRAERVYLDQCVTFYCGSGSDGADYSALAGNEFQTYMRENFVSLLHNQTIFWKTKVYYMLLYLRSLRKGHQ